MNKYQNGKIYKITDVAYTKCYIGSTIELLRRRMAHHKHKYKHYLSDKNDTNSNSRSANSLFDEFGVENCKIELIEMYPCNSKIELEKREGEHIATNKSICVNKRVAGRTSEEWRRENRELHSARARKWKEENAERRHAYQKEYNALNVEKNQGKEKTALQPS